MGRSVSNAGGGVHGIPVALTSFVGRARAVAQVAERLDEHRLVTVVGPGGVGKTRLAAEVASLVAGRFADGAWLVRLSAVRDPAQVTAGVAAVLGVRDRPAAPDALAEALARRQLLLVLDNCEQVIGAVAELCGSLLLGADDVRVLATSREPLRIAGEARYRLGPLTLPDSAGLADSAGRTDSAGQPDSACRTDSAGQPDSAGRTDCGECEAVTLFADRASQADPGFALDDTTRPMVRRLVARLDGLPLAIELAAARVDSLGLTQLLERIDDRFDLLVAGDRLVEQRHRSLVATVGWSYRLLDEAERRVFRAVSVFPGPFTLDGVEAVAGAGTRPVVPRLVDCSMLVPPRVDPDGRTRYATLETLRAYAAVQLADAGEDDGAMAALCGYAEQVAQRAAVGLNSGATEVDSLARLDAEDATVGRALDWAVDHDRGAALRLVLALHPWWQIRGRLDAQAGVLAAVAEYAEHADPGGTEWCGVRLCLGQAAAQSGDRAAALGHFTAVRDALADPGPVPPPWRPAILSMCLDGRSGVLSGMGRIAEAAQDARRALDLARESGFPGLEALALACLGVAAWQAGDRQGALRLVRQAQHVPGDVAGALQRGLGQIITMVLVEAGDVVAAEQACTAGLDWCRRVGDVTGLAGQLRNRVYLDLWIHRTHDAAAHLRQQLEIAERIGARPMLLAGLDCCGHLCAATGRPADAVTVWAAMSALAAPGSMLLGRLSADRRDALSRQARHLLGEAATRAAQERGAGMSAATAAEFALLLATDSGPSASTGATVGPDLARLSPRERELVTLVAQGRTDAQIAAELYITVRTVGSHLDRIRDKTGCRRRADLTRLALAAGLV